MALAHTLHREYGELMITALYVDDFLLAGNNLGGINWMKLELEDI